MKKNGLKISVFCLLLLVVFVYLNRIFATDNHFNNSIEAFNKLSSETNIDILFVGSSHSYTAFNPLIINRETKSISSNLGSDALLVPLTDMVVEQALRKTSPKLIILEIYPPSIKTPNSKSSKGYQLRVLDKVSDFSITKRQKVNQFYSNSELMGVYFPLFRNHSEFHKVDPLELSNNEKFDENTTYFNNGYKGLNRILDVASTKKFSGFDTIPPISTSSREIINDTARAHIENLIEISKSQGAEILIVSAPDLRANYYWDASFFTELNAICKIYGISYINMNKYYNEINLKTDDFKDPSHLNISGAYKTSIFLGKYIKENYNLPDRSSEIVWKKIDKEFPRFYDKFIEIEERTFIETIEEPFADFMGLEEVKIEKIGPNYRFSLRIDTTKTDQQEMRNYNLLVKIIPEEKDKDLVDPRFKDRGWDYDKVDVKLERVKDSINFIVSSKIENIKSIQMLLYNKKKYAGTVGKIVTLQKPRFK